MRPSASSCRLRFGQQRHRRRPACRSSGGSARSKRGPACPPAAAIRETAAKRQPVPNRLLRPQDRRAHATAAEAEDLRLSPEADSQARLGSKRESAKAQHRTPTSRTPSLEPVQKPPAPHTPAHHRVNEPRVGKRSRRNIGKIILSEAAHRDQIHQTSAKLSIQFVGLKTE